MTNKSFAELMRERVRHYLTTLGASPEQPVHESILIRGGYYCGRKYHCDGLAAVWFAEENQIKCYDREGNVLAVYPASQDTLPVIARVA